MHIPQQSVHSAVWFLPIRYMAEKVLTRTWTYDLAILACQTSSIVYKLLINSKENDRTCVALPLEHQQNSEENVFNISQHCFQSLNKNGKNK